MGEPDDRDVADQVAAAEKWTAEFDRLDEDERRCRELLAPIMLEADRVAKAGDYARAAELFDDVAAGFEVAGIGGYKLAAWHKRAADCRAAVKLAGRRKRTKGKSKGGK